MPAAPATEPQRRPLNEQSRSQGEKLQIRLVPYSPPRLSSDGVSDIDHPPLRLSLDNVEIHGRDDSPRTATPSVSSLTIPVPTRDTDGNSQEPHLDRDHDDQASGKATPDARQSKYLQRPVSSSPSLTCSPSPSQSTLPWLRPKRVINVHPDGTFSLIPQPGSASSSTDSFSSPHFSSTAPSSSYGRLSSGVFSEGRPSSPPTPLAEHKPSPAASSASPFTKVANPNAVSGSPWNYRLVGGLRKVHSNASRRGLDNSSQSSQSQPLPPSNDAASSIDRPSVLPLTTKQSFQSSETGSTLSDRTNYKVYGRSSPVPSPVDDLAASDFDSHPPSSSDSNYVIHGDLSCSSIGVTPGSQVRTEYSRESLVVAPLRPIRPSRPEEQSLVFKSQSRDTLRTRSLTSMSSFGINQETTRTLLTVTTSGSTQGGMDWQNWRVPSNVGPSISRKSFSRPHQFSTALSTVFSESERASEPSSRALSRLSASGPRSSVLIGNHDKRMGSLASSGLEGTLVATSPSHSRTVSLDRPRPVYNRELSAGNGRLIRHQDEDGDGLADLQEPHRRPSRVRHHSLLSSYSSDRNLWSSGSSRTNSLNSVSIPTWARLYYGSGERRFLATKVSYESMFSQFSDSQPRNSLLSRSPSHEQCATDINNPRRRPREDPPQANDSDSMAIAPHSLVAVARTLKKQTSSIWSPHLHRDRRASRYSIWSPPSLVEFNESNIWRRNIQPLLFVIGFILPFAWMIGAFLSLPEKPQLDMVERDYSTSHLNLRQQSRHQIQDANEIRFHDRTKWWRRVNRRMSVIGLLLISAYVALIVVGVKQQWTSR